MQPVTAIDYCLQLARADAYGDYLCMTMLPPPARLPLLPLIALDAELRAIARKVREEMVAHIRFAWWRENLEALAAGAPPREHPLLQLLAPVARGLSPELLTAIVDAAQEAYPEYLPHGTEALHAACVMALPEAMQPRWHRARMTTHRHRARYGERGRVWLVVKLLVT